MAKFKTNDMGDIKNVCPTCGYDFEIDETNTNIFECGYVDCPEKELTLDQLITYDDDYSWCI